MGDLVRARRALRYARGAAIAEVPARTAIVGNPSDAFGGAVVTLALDDLAAVVRADPHLTARLDADGDSVEYEDLGSLVAAGERAEYPREGPLALLMAAAKRWAATRPAVHDTGVRLYLAESSIPPGVGLAGSSAIVVGALRALGDLFGEEVPEAELPSVALACERDELDIPGGLGDRVAQTAGGLVFLDLARGERSSASIEPLDASRLPPLFVAWRPAARTHSGETHREVAKRFAAGDREVVATMREIADLARLALRHLIVGDAGGLGMLMDRNLELRRRLYDLDPRHAEMVSAAQATGAPVNYTGSGGAIVGLFRDEDHLVALRDDLEPLGCDLLVRR